MPSFPRSSLLRAATAAVLVATALAGCGSGQAGDGASAGGTGTGPSSTSPTSAPPANLLRNPGFEEGTAGWFWYESQSSWQPFHVGANARSGASAATTPLTSQGEGANEIAGFIQNFTMGGVGGRLPATVGGHYQVERWDTNLNRTYIQALLTLWPEPGAQRPLCPGLPSPRNPCQLAIVLGGIDRVPFNITNRKFVFEETAEPVAGPEWRSFDLDLRAAFERAWGGPPTAAVAYAWLYFEVRYEQGGGPEPDVELVVHWDDLTMHA